MPLRLLLALLLSGCATVAPAQQRADTALPPPPTLRDRADVLGIVFPTAVSQGAMVIGKVPAGSRVRYGGRDLRVTPYGSVVFGVGRDETGPLQVEVTPPLGVPVGQNTAGVPRPMPTPLEPAGSAEAAGSVAVGQMIWRRQVGRHEPGHAEMGPT